MCSLDHYNYVMWLFIHLNEMANLHKTHPAIYEEFLKGNFTVQKLHWTTTMSK